jgi:hypothetical protein
MFSYQSSATVFTQRKEKARTHLILFKQLKQLWHTVKGTMKGVDTDSQTYLQAQSR